MKPSKCHPPPCPSPKELSHSGLVSSRQVGRFIYYSTDYDQMAALMTFLTQNCCQACRRSV